MNRGIFGLLLIFFCFAFSYAAQATHLRGGEISYRTDPDNPLKVYVELTVYLSTMSPVREDEVEIRMGDGNTRRAHYLPELDQPLQAHTYSRTWRAEHTYTSPGTYRLSYTGINRNEGVANASNSSTHTFFLYTWVSLSPLAGTHASPRLLAPPIMRGVRSRPFHHNLTAYDPDGDSLAYELVQPLSTPMPPGQQDASGLPGYQFPEDLTIHPHSGEMVWVSAGSLGDQAIAGEFTVAVRVTKYRKEQVLSRMVRDFQIEVVPASFQPTPILILNRENTGVSAENKVEAPQQQPLEVRLSVSKEGADSVQVRAYSELFLAASSRPSFTFSEEQEAVWGVFRYTPEPGHLRSLPYLVSFRATYFFSEHPNVPVQKDLTLVVYVTRQVLTGLSGWPGDSPQAHRLYPSPVRDELFVEVPDPQERQLVLYSLDGKEVLRQSLTFPRTRIQRPSHLKAGVYRYTLSGPSGSAQAGKVLLH